MTRRVYMCLGVMAMLAWLMAAAGLAQDRFTDNGDGTITDHERGLMWAASDNQGDINWHQAEKWVRYTFPFTLPVMYDNWRLPTLKELQSLVLEGEGYETACGQWVKIFPAIRLSCGWVWTSESGQLGPTATVFNFNNVYYYSVRKVQKRAYRALPVRNSE
jgi:hypothetical protein